ncbi:GntR family transcriptional regulator [Microbacterium sp. KR10-403]|uniref:GntR family transcriptional regulator n=1 Tax=Microbacterium sp. KR10-403 TaxID=3158581 RepID=UPI0032E3D6F2
MAVGMPRAETEMVSELISDRLYRILTDRIITGVLQPGERIDPGAIASEFGVSRAPVRDALTRMEFEQMVETRARYGSFVVRPTVQDIHEVCQFRKAVEWVATGLATTAIAPEELRALRAEAVHALKEADRGVYEPFFESDSHLHNAIIAATGNTRLLRARSAVEPWVTWLRVLGATGVHRIAGSTARHLEILDAMLAGDAETAQRIAALHLDEVEAWAIEDFPGVVGSPDDAATRSA